ncbi:hypothetical protein O9K51_05364 [Purpureocillium lavendulum]|uniref:Uncharacterized protein n=1 Tax=Purpureocillium lavendulum TaxID=1247861 RepID=A0AB34FSJ1_9HYPO|nr:hypothetical protein O9K51_05364 [Purpureocillium lavendulum]
MTFRAFTAFTTFLQPVRHGPWTNKTKAQGTDVFDSKPLPCLFPLSLSTRYTKINNMISLPLNMVINNLLLASYHQNHRRMTQPTRQNNSTFYFNMAIGVPAFITKFFRALPRLCLCPRRTERLRDLSVAAIIGGLVGALLANLIMSRLGARGKGAQNSGDVSPMSPNGNGSSGRASSGGAKGSSTKGRSVKDGGFWGDSVKSSATKSGNSGETSARSDFFKPDKSKGEGIRSGSVKEGALKDGSARDAPLKSGSIKEERARGDSTRDSISKDDRVRGDSMRDGSVRGDSVRGDSVSSSRSKTDGERRSSVAQDNQRQQPLDGKEAHQQAIARPATRRRAL